MAGDATPGADFRFPVVVNLVSLSVSLVVALALPTIYFGLGFRALESAARTKAVIKSEIVTQLIASQPEMWRYSEHRLTELVTRFPIKLQDERVLVIDAKGAVVASTDESLARPILVRSAPVFDAGTTAGRVEIHTSYRGLLADTALAALLGLIIGGVLFAVLRILPARANRLVDAMFGEKERAEVTLHSIGDGVIVTDRNQIVEYLNPVAESLTKWSSNDAVGRPLAEVMQLMDETTLQPAQSPMEQALRENSIATFTSQVALIRRDGSSLAIEDSAAPIHDRHGKVIGGVMVFHDVSAARSMAQRISWAATHDSLTGLVNRREFEVRVDGALNTAQNQGVQHALCYMDLDQFKIVNDTCGHVAGDTLLKQLSDLLSAKLRKTDTFARLGGDEFGLLLEGCPLDRARMIAADLLATVTDYRFTWEGKMFRVGLSIGLVAIDSDSTSKTEVLSAADSACYAAKKQGRGRISVYHIADAEIAQHRKEIGWAARLARAIEEQRFTLYYQPYLDLAPKESKGKHIEILLRLIDEDGRIVMPGSFIPAAERYNMMPAIDRWVIETAFARYHELSAELGSPLTCALNLSGTSLNSEGLLDHILEHAKRNKLPQGAICFEITETAAINNLRQATLFMKRVKEFGFQFALDDFGTGTSSFGYLKSLPIDFLKIDGSFIRSIADDPLDRTMAETINRVGHIMGLKTVGEFAESDSAVRELKSLGVDFAQGYGVQAPRPLPLPGFAGAPSLANASRDSRDEGSKVAVGGFSQSGAA